jgi:hypothetical protein
MALTSAPGSNAVDCTRMAMLSLRSRWEKRDFIAAQRLVELHSSSLRAHIRFCSFSTATRIASQCLAHGVDSGEVAFHLQGIHADRFA